MSRKFMLLLTALFIAALVSPASALAWANGGNNRNGYGTHDWILDQAIRRSGTDGAWVNRKVALLASDDPDSYRTWSMYHGYKETGRGRGAAHMVSSLYEKAIAAHRAGDDVTASKYLGWLSHYYADICQPFHTTNKATGRYHSAYEYAVSDAQHYPNNVRSWITPRAYVPVTDIRKKTVSAAAYSRARYPALYKSLKKSRNVKTGRNNSITRQVQSRAVNDLADIIRTVPRGTGTAAAPARTLAYLKFNYPRQNMKLGYFVRCLDANGKPLEGVGVYMTWKLTTGTTKILTFTEKDGWARYYQNTGQSALLKKAYVTSSISASGVTTSTSDFFVPTKEPADGQAGFRVDMPNRWPTSTVVANAVVKDRHGRGIAGVPVAFSWTFDNRMRETTVYTNSTGHAPFSMPAQFRRTGGKQILYAESQLGGHNRSSGATFIF